MMKRLVVLFVPVVLLVGCGDDGDDESSDWLDETGIELPDDVRTVGEVQVSDNEQMVYVESCDEAERITSAGSEYGPKGGKNGYAYVCDN